MRNLRSALLVFALSLTTSLVHAQSADDSLHVVDETIVTGSRLAIPRANAIATKMPLPLRKTPLSVGIVPQALIETQDGATLSDAVANVSGVGVHTQFRRPRYVLPARLRLARQRLGALRRGP